jgi:hypothetical protein
MSTNGYYGGSTVEADTAEESTVIPRGIPTSKIRGFGAVLEEPAFLRLPRSLELPAPAPGRVSRIRGALRRAAETVLALPGTIRRRRPQAVLNAEAAAFRREAEAILERRRNEGRWPASELLELPMVDLRQGDEE